MDTGWIKSYRSIIDHELLANDNAAYIVFMKLLHKVDHKTGRYITGRFKLSELTNLPPTTAWDALKRLEKAKMAVIKSDNKKSTITICNWHKYQGNADSPTVIKPTSNRHQTDTKQEVIRKKEIPKGISADNRDPQVTQLIEHFEKHIGKLSRSTYQPMAAMELIKQHGFERSIAGVNAAAAVRDRKFAPSIANLEDLRDKWINLENFYHREMKPKGVKIS